MSDFNKSVVGFLQLGCRIFTSRISDFTNFVVEFSTTRMAPSSFRRNFLKENTRVRCARCFKTIELSRDCAELRLWLCSFHSHGHAPRMERVVLVNKIFFLLIQKPSFLLSCVRVSETKKSRIININLRILIYAQGKFAFK